MSIDWIEPWSELWTNPESVLEELIHEVGSGHILFGKKCKCIGRREDCDDFLFEVKEAEFQYAVVHLTYSSSSEMNPKFPITNVYHSLDEFVELRMCKDAESF